MTLTHKTRKHSLETRQKIAKSNTGKVFSQQRCDAISHAKTFKVSSELLEKLNYYWSLGYLNPKMIMELCEIKTASTYKRIFTEYCKYPQLQFMPKDLHPNEAEKIIELAKQKIPYKIIAQQVDRGHKQIYSIIQKLNIEPTNMKSIQTDTWISKLEKSVGVELQKLGIKLESQFCIDPFYFDYKVVGLPIVIEVHGDYWHCNPTIYKNGPINDLQKSMMKRDFAKKAKAKALGYKRLVIWENCFKFDKTNTLKQVCNKIKEYEDATNNI